FSRDWSSDVCSSDLVALAILRIGNQGLEVAVGHQLLLRGGHRDHAERLVLKVRFSRGRLQPVGRWGRRDLSTQWRIEHVAIASRSEERRVGTDGRAG